MRLHLKDLVFNITRATLTGVVPDPYWSSKYNQGAAQRLVWSVDIQAGKQVLTWDTAYNEESGEPNDGFDHCII
jgi:hypothetical protein